MPSSPGGEMCLKWSSEHSHPVCASAGGMGGGEDGQVSQSPTASKLSNESGYQSGSCCITVSY